MSFIEKVLKKVQIIDFIQQMTTFFKQNAKSDRIKLKNFEQKCD